MEDPLFQQPLLPDTPSEIPDRVDSGDIRCPLCHNAPLLATYGVDKRGVLYIHIKVYKARQVKADVYITGGEVTLKCYRCMRYNTVRIVAARPVLSRTRRPSIDEGNPMK